MINKRYCIIVLLAMCVMALIILWMCNNKSTNKISHSVLTDSQKQLRLEELLGIIKQKEQIELQVYYMPFHVDASVPTEEGHLFLMSFVTSTYKNIWSLQNTFLENILDNFSASRQKDLPPYNDFRYCCLVRSKSNKFIRFSISKYSLDTIFINGEPYKASYELIDSFLKLLPARDYELLMQTIDVGGKTNMPIKGV